MLLRECELLMKAIFSCPIEDREFVREAEAFVRGLSIESIYAMEGFWRNYPLALSPVMKCNEIATASHLNYEF